MGEHLPVVDLGGARATAVAAGTAHTCALLDDGMVRCWGSNGAGQVGDGTTSTRTLPVLVDFVEGDLVIPERIAALTAGHVFTCARLDSGAVRCWGDNAGGQLGTGGVTDVKLPQQTGNVGLGVSVTSIATGNSHTCVLDDGGRIKCWGLANFGQLGLGDTKNQGDEANEIAGLPFVDLGSRSGGDEPLRVTDVVAGGDHTCALLETGRVKCWGDNAFGQLGLGDREHRGDRADEMGDALPEVPLPGPVVGR
jgi:alpha-tubulin suppressor-like RCC1 family protein